VKFSVQLPTNQVAAGQAFLGAQAIGAMARACESAGFDAVYVTEHPFPAADWLAAGGHHALDPFVSLAAAAAVTERIGLHTNILVLPYRNPFLAAKAVASLDVVSGGRTIVGVAAGYLEAEYAALGADFGHRNDACDDALEAMKEAWSGATVVRKGAGYEATGNRMLPVPLQVPHPPLWIGGNSVRALRRVVAHGQGWSPFPAPAALRARTRTAALETMDDLAAGIRRLRALADEAGRRDAIDVNFVPFGRGMDHRRALDAAAFREQVAAYAAIGVTWLTIGMPTASPEAYTDAVAAFGEEVIAKA